MNREKESALDIVMLTVGEIIVSLLVVGAYLICDLAFEAEFWDFSYRVVTGVILGSVVTVANYMLLTLSVNKAIKNFLTLRGTREMNEEEAAKFASENAMQIQNAIKTSFLVRTVSIVVTLVIAFILDWFAPLATVIPLLMFRPLLTVGEMIKRKFIKQPEMPLGFPSAITYGEDEVNEVAREIPMDDGDVEKTNNEEKESEE